MPIVSKLKVKTLHIYESNQSSTVLPFTLLLSTQVLKKSKNSNQLYSAVQVNHFIVYKKLVSYVCK